MSVARPSDDDLRDIARRYHFGLADGDVTALRAIVDTTLASYDRLDELDEPIEAPRWPRDGGRAPAAGENPYGAWAWMVDIAGAPDGPLAGRTVAVKDNICVAGVPMSNGTSLLSGYVPEADATVVERVLGAGGRVVGKAVCESLCFSGGSHTSDSGPVRNPYDITRTTGGSSSGCAALLAAGQVDLAIGGDQGGSVRIPACWSGVHALKPTWGLVPYTGAFPIEATLDHLGPMARSAADVALLLEVLAGPDGLDPRQGSGPRPEPFAGAALTGDVGGLRLGLVAEGFAWDGLSEPVVDEAVRAAAASFSRLGATVSEVSVPWHRDGIHVWNGIALEGATALMVAGNGMATNWKGRYTTSLLEHFGRARRERGDALSVTTKLNVLAGQWMSDTYLGRYYGKAQNLARALAAAYDRALADHDLLVMPTLPLRATEIPESTAPLAEQVGRALEMIPNT
ncbi:MAG: amidase, partial [Acidimicrobiales bacterium]